MALDDLIAKFESFTAPGTGEPDIDAVLSGVTEVYNSDIAVRDQAVQTVTKELEAEKAETAKLRQHNYDLLMKQPQSNVQDNSNKNDADELDESERAATIRVDSLFTKRK